MNTSNNRRYQETEHKINRAFFQLLDSGKTIDQIFVQDICQIAHISRPSFYTHYEDINDMIVKIEKEKAKSIRDILISEAIPSGRTLEKYFEYLQENRSFYIAYFSSGDNSHIAKPLMDAYFKQNRNYHEQTGLSGESLKYLMSFFASGLKAVACDWLTGGCRESPAQMASLVQKIKGML